MLCVDSFAPNYVRITISFPDDFVFIRAIKTMYTLLIFGQNKVLGPIYNRDVHHWKNNGKEK